MLTIYNSCSVAAETKPQNGSGPYATCTNSHLLSELYIPWYVDTKCDVVYIGSLHNPVDPVPNAHDTKAAKATPHKTCTYLLRLHRTGVAIPQV